MRTPFSRTRRGRGIALLSSGMIIAGAALVALALLFVLARAFIPGALTAVASPLWSAGGGLTAAAGGSFAYFTDRAELAAERDRLEREIEGLDAELAAKNAQIADLTRLVGTRTEPAGRVLAAVHARPPVSPYDTLVLDQGSDAGITEGAFVMGPGGVPVGTVGQVAKESSRVLLYSAPGRLTEGWVGVNRLPLTLEGAGAGAFRANVPRDAAVAPGDAVFLPGASAPLGTIVRVDTDPSSPRAVVHVRPAANPFSLTWVEVTQSL